MKNMSGNYVGYRVEYLDREKGKWFPVSLKETPDGVPLDIEYKGINLEMGLLSYEQAMSIAWKALADCKAIPYTSSDVLKRRMTKVRLMPFKVKYDISSSAVEEQAIELDEKQHKQVSKNILNEVE